jgi:hypothetical protein
LCRSAVWDIDRLGLSVARLIVTRLLTQGEPITAMIDDTLFKCWGCTVYTRSGPTIAPPSRGIVAMSPGTACGRSTRPGIGVVLAGARASSTAGPAGGGLGCWWPVSGGGPGRVGSGRVAVLDGGSDAGAGCCGGGLQEHPRRQLDRQVGLGNPETGRAGWLAPVGANTGASVTATPAPARPPPGAAAGP